MANGPRLKPLLWVQASSAGLKSSFPLLKQGAPTYAKATAGRPTYAKATAGRPANAKATVGRPTNNFILGNSSSSRKPGRIEESRKKAESEAGPKRWPEPRPFQYYKTGKDRAAQSKKPWDKDEDAARSASVLVLAGGGGRDAAEDGDAGAA